MKRRPTALSELVAQVLDRQSAPGTTSPGRQVVRVFDAFRHIGPPVADHAAPVRFQHGILTLAVDSPCWLTELRFLQSEVLDRLNSRLGTKTVHSIKLRLGALPAKAAAPKPPPAPRRASAELLEQIEEWGGLIRDPEIRVRMMRAAERSLTRPPRVMPPKPRRFSRPVPSEDAD